MRVTHVLALVLLVAGPAAADPVSLRFENGFVTLSARNVPVRQVLAEWARLGQTRVVNAEKVPGGMVTLELAHVPEKQALEVLLRSAAGYMAAPRAQMTTNLSAYDRIVVMPTSSAAPPPAAAGAYRTPPPQVQQPPPAFNSGQPPFNGQPAFNGGLPPPMPAEEQDGSGALNPDGSPVEPDSDQQQPMQPAVPTFGPQGPQQGPEQGNQNDGEATPPAQQAPPPPPGPTPLAPGVITAPSPGQMPTPQKPPDQ
jgi:hypothetical protein